MRTIKIINKASVSVLLFVLCFSLAKANSKLIFETANKHYANSEFEQAIILYDSCLTIGFSSANLYYNLGNSYYKTNQIGRAVLNYERALKLKPGNSDINHNLKLANKSTIDKIEINPQLFIVAWGKKLLSFFSAKRWAFFALLFIWFSLIAFAFYFFAKNMWLRKLSFYKGIALLIVSILLFGLAILKQVETKTHSYGILLTPSISVRSAPDVSGKDLFILHEGTKAEIVDSVNNWLQIKTSDGNIGWVEGIAIGLI